MVTYNGPVLTQVTVSVLVTYIDTDADPSSTFTHNETINTFLESHLSFQIPIQAPMLPQKISKVEIQLIFDGG